MQLDPLLHRQRSFKLDAKQKSCSLPLKVKAFVPSLNFDLLSLFPPHRWPNKNLNFSPSLASFNLFEAVSFEASFTMAGFVEQKLGVRVFVWQQWQNLFDWNVKVGGGVQKKKKSFFSSNDAFSYKIYFCSFNKQWKLFAFNSHARHITPYQIRKGTCGLKLPPNDRLLLLTFIKLN